MCPTICSSHPRALVALDEVALEKIASLRIPVTVGFPTISSFHPGPARNTSSISALRRRLDRRSPFLAIQTPAHESPWQELDPVSFVVYERPVRN